MSEPELKEKIEQILENGVKDMAEKIIEAVKTENTNNPVWGKSNES